MPYDTDKYIGVQDLYYAPIDENGEIGEVKKITIMGLDLAKEGDQTYSNYVRLMMATKGTFKFKIKYPIKKSHKGNRRNKCNITI